MGFEASTTQVSRDGGIDIIALSASALVSGKYVIQCKDWGKPVGEPELRGLYGVVHAENANKGIMITTSSFTGPAREFAEGKQLELETA
jgi:restriction system protein